MRICLDYIVFEIELLSRYVIDSKSKEISQNGTAPTEKTAKRGVQKPERR